MVDLETLLEILSKAEVEQIIVGGLAAIAHSSTSLTQDLNKRTGRTHLETTPRLYNVNPCSRPSLAPD